MGITLAILGTDLITGPRRTTEALRGQSWSRLAIDRTIAARATGDEASIMSGARDTGHGAVAEEFGSVGTTL